MNRRTAGNVAGCAGIILAIVLAWAVIIGAVWWALS